MLTHFTLLCAAGAGLRLVISYGLVRFRNTRLIIPQGLAIVFLALAAMPDWFKPIPFPLPFSVTLGFVLPDLLTRRL